MKTQFHNPSWRGHPLDVEFGATFRHVTSDRVMRHLGYYAGSKTWCIRFMPDEPGKWQYTTYSSDPDLDGHTGSFHAIEGTMRGPLSVQGNRWHSFEGRSEFPVMLSVGAWFRATDTEDGVADFIRWTKEVAGGRLVGQVLISPAGGYDSYVFDRYLGHRRYNFKVWDKLNAHFDALRDVGLGHYIMIFTDDESAPDRLGIRPYSNAELRLLRYIVARFAAYPTVVWDSGIDIGEYRDDNWIAWFAEWFRDHDPWNHPIGSRSGGGSGGHHPAAATYWSDGEKELPPRQQLTKTIVSRSQPTFFTDRWREDFGRGNFDRHSLRRAAWSVALAGGAGFSTAGEKGVLTAPPHGTRYDLDLEVAPEIGHLVRFINERVRNFGRLAPADGLSSGSAFVAANPGMEYVVYDYGTHPIDIDLSGATGHFDLAWFNPASGAYFHSEFPIAAGSRLTLPRPSQSEWTVHLVLREVPAG